MAESIAELKGELDRAKRMAAMIHAIGEKAMELQSENELMRKRIAQLTNGAETKPDDCPVTAWDCLAVTNVQVAPVAGQMYTKATAAVVLNDQFILRGLRVMDGESGLFVAYPIDTSCKGENSRSLCHPITKQLREHIENCVLEKYSQMMEA